MGSYLNPGSKGFQESLNSEMREKSLTFGDFLFLP